MFCCTNVNHLLMIMSLLDPPVLFRNAGSKLTECAQQLLLKMYVFQWVRWRIIFFQCSLSFWLKCILHMHKGLRQIFTRYIISGLLPRPMQVQNKAESYLLFLGPSWKSPTRRWEPLICTCICVHWLGPCICFSWQKLSFCKKQKS